MRKKGYLIAALLITVFALFASNAFAVVIGGWTIEPVLGPNGVFPVDDMCNGTPCSKFSYDVSGGGTNVSLIDLLVPVCYDDINGDGITGDNDIMLLSTDPSSGKLLDPGVGDTANGYFGVSILDTRVLKLPYNIMTGNTFRFTFWTTRAKSRNTSIQLKSGNKLFAGIVKGPECYLPVPGTTTYKEVLFDPLHPDSIVKVAYSADGSVLGVYNLDGTPISPLSFTDVQCSVNGGPLKPVSFMTEECLVRLDFHTCLYKNIGGRLYPYSCTTY